MPFRTSHKFPTPSPGQQTEKPAEDAQAPSAGGVNTGPPHAAQFDPQHRPITAGGFVKTGPVVFEDISEKAGLTNGPTRWARRQKKYIIETKGRAWA